MMMAAYPRIRGRLAPSPTGLLHLGNAWAFLMAWLLCRSAHGQLVLRMEDIDPARSRSHFAAAILDDLTWLGLDWDEGPDCSGPCGSYVQSERLACYEQALEQLRTQGRVYPCFCTRKELRALAGAPHVGDEGAPYPGTCRELTEAEQQERRAAGYRPCQRLRCPVGDADVPYFFDDLIQGQQALTLTDCGGDFALQRSDGVVAYQLAVVVDDGLMGITQVVRGADLIMSTPRQLALQQQLGWPAPQYAHVPLLCDEQGERLAKRHQGLSLHALRDAGIDPRAVIGYVAWKAGLSTQPCLLHPRELLHGWSAASPSTLWPDWWRGQPVILDADPLTVLHRLG